MRTNGSIAVGAIVRLNTHAMKRHVLDRIKQRIPDKKQQRGSFRVCELVEGHATLQSDGGLHVTVPKHVLIPN